MHKHTSTINIRKLEQKLDFGGVIFVFDVKQTFDSDSSFLALLAVLLRWDHSTMLQSEYVYGFLSMVLD